MQVSGPSKEPGFSHKVCRAMTHLPEASWYFCSLAGCSWKGLALPGTQLDGHLDL